VVGSIFIFIFFFSSPALSAECGEAVLLEQFAEIEKRVGTVDSEDELADFLHTLSKCKIGLEPLYLSTRIDSLQNKNSVANVRRQIEGILQVPRRNSEDELGKLRAFGLRIGMKRKEFDLAGARLRELNFAADEKAKEKIRERCETKDQSIRLPPTHNQGGLGWCYAYVAADLLSLEIGKTVAPLSIGLGYFQKNNYESFVASDLAAKEKILNLGGGHIVDAISIAQMEGICPARQDVEIGDLFDRVFSLLDNTKIPTWLENQEKFCDAYASASLTLFPNISTSEFERILRKAGVHEILHEMRKANCRKKTKLPKNLKVENIFYPNRTNVQSVEVIQKALLRNSAAGISVNLNTIVNQSLTPEQHAMIVVGQEWNSSAKQCEFIVRNSWGNQCENFNSLRVSCDPKTGHIRVPADTLERITYGTTVLKR